MADTKLSALSNLAEVPANNDEFYIFDASAVAGLAIAAAFLRRAKVDIVVASGAVTPNAIQLITLNLGTAIALTLTGSPTAGDILAIYRKGSGAVTHTVDVAGGITWEGTNDRANLADDGDCLIAIAESATRWIVLYNNGVTFS
jgi:hypothetical protein